MDYSKIYIDLMERASNRVVDGYTEKHHIVPKCMGGDNKERNLVQLTPEEHYLAHQLLVKIYPKNHSLIFAAKAMTITGDGQVRNNKHFGWLKRQYSKSCSERMQGNTFAKGNSNRKGIAHTKASKLKMSQGHLGSKNHWHGKFGAEHSRSKRVVQYSKGNELITTFNSITEAGNTLGIKNTSISRCCKGGRPSAGGFIWKYEN